MNTGVKAAALAASSLILFGVAPAYAGVDAVRAEAYFNAISGGNAETIASFYADDAEFHWVGGPLAGVYKGRDRIKAVWEKFAAAAGDIDHEVLQLSESANGKTSTVTARVKFKGEGEVPVKFVLVYKEGKIANEVWQVDKTGADYAKADGKPEAKPDAKPSKAEEKVAGAAPLPEARPTRAPAGAVQAAVVTERLPAPEATPDRLAANTPDQPSDGSDTEAGYLPDDEKGADAPQTDAAPTDVPLPQARRAEIAPDKDLTGEPKLKAPSAPKAKAPEEKKSGAFEKPDDKKAAKKKRSYGDGYGYDRDYDDYGYGRRGYGRYGGYDGYGYGRHGYGGYGYGRYGGHGYGGYGGGYGGY